MSRNYLFQNNRLPLNYQLLDNPNNAKRLIASKFNAEIYQVVHLLIANASAPPYRYELYNWNITSNMLALNFVSPVWNCSVKCEISASATLFLLESQTYSHLYRLGPNYLIQEQVVSYKKNIVSILNETCQIRKKSDVNRKNFVFVSGKELLTLSYNNDSVALNVFPIPLAYNFNPNNFVLDTKLYQNKLYILYRSIVTYNIYLYEFQQAQLLFQQYPNGTRLNATGVTITEVFRFNNNYISKVIRFARGVNQPTGGMIIWAYNDNEAYKCLSPPCLGFGYEIYNNIVFSAVTATNSSIAFYGRSNMIELKKFKPNLISEEIGKYYFNSNVSLAEMISYANFTVNKLLVATPGALFPTVYNLIDDCKRVQAFEDNNFCECRAPYTYSSALSLCEKAKPSILQANLDTIYIAFIAICAGIFPNYTVLLLTLIFIIYRKIISLQRIRKSWQYNAADNIIFE